MIDYEKIGRRIYEERKYIRHISQEKMAEDLGMYQADISNLEKAKKSSGITDLNKLQLIADYFSLPIENLLFGTSAEAHMVNYEGEEEMAASEFYGCIKYLRSIIRNTDSTDPVEVVMDYGKDINEMDLPSLASYEDDDEDYDDEE